MNSSASTRTLQGQTKFLQAKTTAGQQDTGRARVFWVEIFDASVLTNGDRFYLCTISINARMEPQNLGLGGPANEIRFMSAGDATLQLFLANKRQREAGLVMESSQELSTHIQISGKAQLAIHNQYKARGYNFFLCCAHPPSIYQAAKDDGWFVRLRNDEREWKKRFHDRTVPHHTLAVKIYSRT
ncbi:hypothetical protein MMC12_008313, partial [Toensbergia leucococca]|nr:hypothetical protein [Toensbergia leucococca]